MHPSILNPSFSLFHAFGVLADLEVDGVSHVVEPSHWEMELGTRMVASRMQLPLKLAYALSIHKSQGMTISSLEVSLEGVFEYGQAYTALSRAVSLDRLIVRGFKPSVVKAHPKVIAFYQRLISAAGAGMARGTYDSATIAGNITDTPRIGGASSAGGRGAHNSFAGACSSPGATLAPPLRGPLVFAGHQPSRANTSGASTGASFNVLSTAATASGVRYTSHERMPHGVPTATGVGIGTVAGVGRTAENVLVHDDAALASALFDDLDDFI